MNDLESYRHTINEIDNRFIDILSERFRICKEVADFKKKNNIPLMQPQRIETVKARCASRAAIAKIDPEFVRKLYDLIIDEACRLEQEIIEE